LEETSACDIPAHMNGCHAGESQASSDNIKLEFV